MIRVKDRKTSLLLGLIIIFLQIGIIYNFINQDNSKKTIPTVINKNSPYVVGIDVTQIKKRNTRSFWNPFYQYYKTYEVDNLGSGLIYSPDGYIITNAHVIIEAKEIIVTLLGGVRYNATIVGVDNLTDLALIKINADNLSYAILGDSNDLNVGESVVALGNPLGLFNVSHQPTATSGIISGVNVDFGLKNEKHIYQDMIQTDASINPGNSGGPLINMNSEVIGINTFIMTASDQQSGSIGIGFSIPINRVKDIINDLIEFGTVKRSYTTGIHIQDVDKFTQQYLRLSKPEGVLITDVEKRSAGQRAGLKIGDVILELDNNFIKSKEDVFRSINEGLHKVGDTIKITIWRPSSGQKVNFDLSLEESKSKVWGFK